MQGGDEVSSPVLQLNTSTVRWLKDKNCSWTSPKSQTVGEGEILKTRVLQMEWEEDQGGHGCRGAFTPVTYRTHAWEYSHKFSFTPRFHHVTMWPCDRRAVNIQTMPPHFFMDTKDLWWRGRGSFRCSLSTSQRVLSWAADVLSYSQTLWHKDS